MYTFINVEKFLNFFRKIKLEIPTGVLDMFKDGKRKNFSQANNLT